MFILQDPSSGMTKVSIGYVWKAILEKGGRVLLGRSRFYSDGRDFTRRVEILLAGLKFY